jgi:flagellar protein FlaG
MTLQIGRFTPYAQIAAAAQPVDGKPATDDPKGRAKAHGAHAAGAIVGDVPPAPTPEAREMVNKAAEVVDQLHKSNRELHFTKDHATNRVVIEVRDLDGNVLKTIPPAKALDILSGTDKL